MTNTCFLTPLINLSKEKVNEDHGSRLILEKNFIKWILRGETMVLNEDLNIWEETIHDRITVVKKSGVAGLEYHLCKDPQNYLLTIMVDGVGEDISIYFPDKESCMVVYEAVLNYIQ